MNGIRPDRPTHPSLTEPLWSLIRKCWNQMAKGRPKIGDVIKELKEMSVYSSPMSQTCRLHSYTIPEGLFRP